MWILLAVLLVVTLAAYFPAWHGGMLWDDNRHLTASDLRSPAGLSRIWFDIGATQQYYPVTHSAFWIQQKIWGNDTLGYHIINIVLHVLSACLFALCLRRLEIPGGWLAAAIFALHPVHVESVAWMTELKNTLSGFLYLCAAWFYIGFDRDRRVRHYGAALILFLLALLSKTVAASLPASLLVVFWWHRGRLSRRRDLIPLLPFFALGAGMGLVTARFEQSMIATQNQAAEYLFSPLERCLIAGRAVWFYLGKLFWPVDLVFIYPRWEVSQGVWWQYLFPLLLIVLFTILWLSRNRCRAPLASLAIFCITLFPVLGFLNVYPFRYSFVADHFQYLASLPIIALVCAGLATAARRQELPYKPVIVGLALVLTGPLAALTWSQSRQYIDGETLYRATISGNPSCWMAMTNLGLTLHGKGRFEEAVTLYRDALKWKPDLAETRFNLGNSLQSLGRLEEAMIEYKEALRLEPDFVEAHSNLGIVHHHSGRLEEAAAEYMAALRLKPDYAIAHNNLGWALQGMGRLEQAVSHYQEALRLKPDFPSARSNLASAVAELQKGRATGKR